jgi:GAF domain-containing protein
VTDGNAKAFGKFDLKDLGVLRKEPDRDFDTAVMLASRSLRTPIATFSVLDFEGGIARLRAHVGTNDAVAEVYEIPITTSLTLSAMSESDVISIPDTGRDPLTQNNPFVASQSVQSLLAAPVLCPAQDVVAMIGVHDRVPRIWTAEDKQTILGFAHFCTQVILLRASLRTLGIVSRRGRPPA